MMLRGDILSSVEEYIYFIGLLPNEFMCMTLHEISKVYEQRMKRIEFDNKSNDRRTARICSVLANIHRDSKKKKKPFSEDDFMPVKQEKKKPQSINTMAAILKAVTIANGGKVRW